MFCLWIQNNFNSGSLIFWFWKHFLSCERVLSHTFCFWRGVFGWHGFQSIALSFQERVSAIWVLSTAGSFRRSRCLRPKRWHRRLLEWHHGIAWLMLPRVHQRQGHLRGNHRHERGRCNRVRRLHRHSLKRCRHIHWILYAKSHHLCKKWSTYWAWHITIIITFWWRHLALALAQRKLDFQTP